MTAHTDPLLRAMRCPDTVPCGDFGPWTIERHVLAPDSPLAVRGWPSQTVLSRHTIATLHEARGEIVMEDGPLELSRHLPILMRARGRVLVTGLGLGCVLRGLLAIFNVTSIDVVEVDEHILLTIGPEFLDNPRVHLHRGDALSIHWDAGTRWDYAWHDIWSPNGGADLQFMHVQLLARYRDRCGPQGAWQLPRVIKRRASMPLLG